MVRTRQFFIFSTFFGIFHSVFCENYSVNPFSFQLNKKSDLESARFPKENVFENPVQDKINDRRRLFFNEDDMNSAINAEREGENNNYSARRRSNFSEPENEKMFNWGNVRLQFPLPVNPEKSRNFADASVKQHFLKENNLNQRYDWEKSDIFEKGQSRWNEEKNFKEFPNQDLRAMNYYNGRVGGLINDSEMNREDRRGDIFDRRISITTLNDAEVRKMKNYNERVGNIHSGHMGHSNANYYNENRNNFLNPNLFKPEKGVVINLKTECSTPRQFNNQLVHKFIFTPKSPISTQSEFLGFQIPESGFISSHKMTPIYYL